MKRALQIILFIGIAGLTFSGALTYNELFGAAATCPSPGAPGTILGYPACVYGFFMYLAITVVAIVGLRAGIAARQSRPVALALIAVLALSSAACGQDRTGPDISLVGAWDFVAFTDSGVPAVTTGTWTFDAAGSFTVIGTVTFPGEPTDSLVVNGAYVQEGSRVELTIGGESGAWTLTGNSQLLVLTQIEPPPANTITLRRR